MLLNRLFGYENKPRRPLMPMTVEKGDAIMALRFVKELMVFEAELQAKALR
jgi:hypothetical protein